MTFNVDWTSGHIASWHKYLQPFIGRPVYGLEIGAYEGRSTIWFCDNILTHATAGLVVVDPFNPVTQEVQHIKASGLQVFLENTEPVFRKLTLRVMESSKFFSENKMRFEFIYVDGSHTLVHCATDLVMSWDILQPNGVLIVDDYKDTCVNPQDQDDTSYPVRLAVNAFIKTYQPHVLELGFQAIMRKG